MTRNGWILWIFCTQLILARTPPVERANRLFLESDFTQAIQVYQEAVASPLDEADKPFALYMLGLSYYRIGDLDMGGRVLWKLVSEYPDFALTDNAYLEMANRTSTRGQSAWSEAQIQYEALLIRHPNSESIPEALLGVARIRTKLRAFDAAEQALNRLVKYYSDHPACTPGLFELGMLQSHPGNPARSASLAIQNLNLFVTRPDSDEIMQSLAWFHLGILYWEEGASEEAVSAFHNLIVRFPSSPMASTAQTSIAEIYSGIKLYGKARDAYRQLIENFMLPQQVKLDVRQIMESLEARETGKMQVSAWKAEVDDGKTLAVYSGDVRITVGKMVSEADSAEVEIKSGDMQASGHVRLTWGDEVLIHADALSGDMTKGILTLTGNVSVRQKNRSDADGRFDAITLNLSDGKWKAAPPGVKR